MIYNTPLEAKVAAANKAHAEANRLAPLIVAALEPFHGAKVQNVDGTLSKKVKAALPPLPTYADGPDLSAWIDSSHGYSLRLEVKASTSSKGRQNPNHDYQLASYAEAIVYIADLHNGTLGAFQNSARDPKLRTDYTAAEVVAKRADLRKAKDAVSAAQSALYPFGEYDQ